MKVNLAQKGGLHSSDDQGSLERQKRVNKIQELAKSLSLDRASSFESLGS